jgi:cyclophilin family peptidyl-prolyl cis-trans isomerase
MLQILPKAFVAQTEAGSQIARTISTPTSTKVAAATFMTILACVCLAFLAFSESLAVAPGESADQDDDTQLAAEAKREAKRPANEIDPKFIAKVMAAYASDPTKIRELGVFLSHIVQSSVDADDYERALAPAKVLIDHDDADPQIYNLAGIAAFSTNDFDAAETYLKTADKKGALQGMGKRYLPHLDKYRAMWRREQELRDAEADADDLPRVLLKTNRGDIVVELFENEAPNTVANFISLVEKKFYDGVRFHRVLAAFMAQGGDPDGNGSGGPGYRIRCECTLPEHRLHFGGSLSMAKTAAPDTGGSQFFLMFRPSGPAAGYNLDGKHTVFGRVVEGLDLLAKIQRIDPEAPRPGVKADKIVAAKVLRKRDHEYVPETLPIR